ncbi:hypothetical protein NMU03_16020 [Allocoprobacillus halotolerans]|uniref:PTS EIIA type-4 domain-containing protein n=1 Tax=Allocoprobacillus halotolerans TaxID=2944914 RepID=A0ABY5I541_9FIRM|nr:hypothetical protein [Allocoprobacillus halotolerans]UTY39062.1 hypothetical protein NMU03_16020 [Allocoprobacillus halotolerans]
MRKIILASHGDLAKGMKSTIKMLSGIDDNIVAVGFYDGEDVKNVFNKVESMLNIEDEFIIITDLPGGSVNTVLTPLVRRGNVHLISGMNTVLVLMLALCTSYEIECILNCIDEGKTSMVYVNEILKENKKEESGDFFD